jgi:DNA repair exonuclease SbcCD ATPase subunit
MQIRNHVYVTEHNKKVKFQEDLRYDLDEFKNRKIKTQILALKAELEVKTRSKRDVLKQELLQLNTDITLAKISSMERLLEKAEQNKQIQEKIKKVSDVEQILEKRLLELRNTSNELNTQKTAHLLELHRNESEKTKVESFLKRKLIHELYLKCINRKTGIPSLIMNDMCVKINKTCNRLLNNITDFKLKFEFDKTITLSCSTSSTGVNDEKYISADLSSGFQKFVLDLVLRISLSQISTTVSKPEFLIIDEGFGSLDKTNFGEVLRCLNIVKKMFKYILVISHIPELQQMSDVRINVLSNQLHSKVEFGTNLSSK